MAVPYKRIATEEAFATQEQFAAFKRLLDSGYDDPGFNSLWGFYLDQPGRTAAQYPPPAGRSRRPAASPTWMRPASTCRSCR